MKPPAAKHRPDWQTQASVAICQATGKHAYNSRRDARRTARRLHPGESRLAAYRCGDHWHLGHHGPAYMRGVAS